MPFTYKLMSKIIKTEEVKFPKFLLIKMRITNEMLKPMLKQACQELTLETTRATFWEAVKLYPEYMSKWEPNSNIRITCWYGKKEMNMKNKLELGSAPLGKLMVKLAIPSIVAFFINILYSAKRYSSSVISSVTSGRPSILFILFLK